MTPDRCPACSCASPRVGWCDMHRAWTPALPADADGRRAALDTAAALAAVDTDPRLRPHATPEPR